MSAARLGAAPAPRRGRPAAALVIGLLALVLLIAMVIAIGAGAAGIPLERLAALVGIGTQNPEVIQRDALVVTAIRLPRIAMAVMVGALLAGSGTLMQGLFRNPLADPAMVGVASGAALAAASAIVIADRLATPLPFALIATLLPVAALIGALATTALLYRIATANGQTSIAIFLLGGLALAALCNAGVGVLVFVADDRQLRDITFWMLGSLSGSTWPRVAALAPFFVLVCAALPFVARGLDLLALGESEAFHMGISVQRLKFFCIIVISAAVGSAVAFSGIIGFVGIVVPHLLRLVIGPGHRLLLPSAILLGAALLTLADSFARTIVAPAELPIGIITAVAGAPFFLALLLRHRKLVSL